MRLVIALNVFVACSIAHAETVTMLDPGDSRQYLENWCGGQTLNEVGEGFDAAGRALVVVSVTTTCSTGGRGTMPRTYLACWRVTFETGAIVAKEQLGSPLSWLQGESANHCPVEPSSAGVYRQEDAYGNVLATLSTAAIIDVYRGFLTQP